MQGKLDAFFYCSASGNEPVREWLLGLPKPERRAIGEDIAYVQFKWPIGKPRVDHLRGPIWEIRTTLDNRIARTLFAVEQTNMVLLHGFIKKTRKTGGRGYRPGIETTEGVAKWRKKIRIVAAVSMSS